MAILHKREFRVKVSDGSVLVLVGVGRVTVVHIGHDEVLVVI